MINQIIRFSIQNKLLIAIFTLMMVGAGIWSITKIPIDAVPDITNNQVQVITQAPSLGTEDIEQLITYPVELAMANLPGVVEIRSVSRFGLSLVTIVFKDDMGTYLPRQLVSEKLIEVKEDIPKGFGQPFMGPISTGLGEVYQYTLEVAENFREKYTASDLRTMQDWIIRRQMAMVPGVVEVNAFGGQIKQYEVAVNPDKLKAIGLTIIDIFTALELNNQNTGGAYIEKDHYANFIRGEGLARSLADIENMVIDNVNGLPVTIKDVAKVQFGSAIRYGALTKDGRGEAVGGMILMLKGANSNEVIEAVKSRVAEIQKSLPEGVRIEPFLDRSTLIAQTTGTVSTNLIEGALIVIFVLVFLLGNWRGGLIVASTIPLSLLFAFILMNIFGVWANLMSLGAIDFGIIIDGAVIIVEGSVFVLHRTLLQQESLTTKTKDELTANAASQMMNTAFFGQLIILIVFIPILALEGIEGKMFKPMALTFMFAMIGVMILCLTYVPMMSAWFLQVKSEEKKTWGDRLVHWLENLYEKALTAALKIGSVILITSLLLLGVSIAAFTRMGGEFIPQLDEGDIAFHSILKPGSSLSETIETTTKIEGIIKSQFPEAIHVISRIGVADVPTDPMPMDIADCFIILRPQSEWTSAKTKAELVEKIKASVSHVIGVNFEFTQPIEMRFNELVTGVREDIAIKLFGEDLDILAIKAAEIGKIVAGIQGVGDMKVEATNGLPQITIHYKRQKLAQYGVSINQLNSMVEAAFAGYHAGTIFEGEKRFDLVVRLESEYRQSIENLQKLYISLPNDAQVPLEELANISYQSGPMQISRDNTNRRTYVGINVRGRDVKSLVAEIQQELDDKLTLPAGYYIRYGGAFENLERATNRLKVVVPIALALIFILIFFALQSIQQTLMIYMAIPLASMGGIGALWLRDMPFSISAGVGFIVLFGVAVLNGLVLISGWNELKNDTSLSLSERISLGARRRIRPILLTALTDILGFLPMAISTSSGAEVQQPLATVVIGGMLSATLLTLFVLPILYQWVESRRLLKAVPNTLSILLIIGAFTAFTSNEIQAQETTQISTLEEAIALGLANNGELQATQTHIQIEEQGSKTAFNPNKTAFDFQYGQYNSFRNDFGFTISQSIEFPTVYAKRRALAATKVKQGELGLAIAENDLTKSIKEAWYALAYLKAKEQLLLSQDSLYQKMLHAATVRYETQEGSYLEQMAASSKVAQAKHQLQLLAGDLQIEQSRLQVLLQSEVPLVFVPAALEAKPMTFTADTSQVSNHPMLAYTQQQLQIAEASQAVHQASMLPDLSIGYFNQSLTANIGADGIPADRSERFAGVQVGVAVPIFYGAYKARSEMARLQGVEASQQLASQKVRLQGQYLQQLQQVSKYQKSLEYYQKEALVQVDLMVQQAQLSFENGAIGYIAYAQHLQEAFGIKSEYLETLYGYNQAVVQLEYLLAE